MQNEDGWTALHEACCSGAAEAVAPLLAKGADVKTRCKDGSTPLHKAARCGSKAIVSSLLRAGADLKARDKASPAQLHASPTSLIQSLVDRLIEGFLSVTATVSSQLFWLIYSMHAPTLLAICGTMS